MTKRQWMMVSMLVMGVGWVPLLFIPTGPKKDAKALVAELPAPYATADYVKGQDVFRTMCGSCHTATERGQALNGPNLYRIFGRRAGTVNGFSYSKAMKNAGFGWTPERVDAFIASPQTVRPGTSMAIPGVADPQARRNLVAFLKVASSS